MSNETHQKAFGKYATLSALLGEEAALELMPDHEEFSVITGKVGSMDLKKVISSVETAAKRNELINPDIMQSSRRPKV